MGSHRGDAPRGDIDGLIAATAVVHDLIVVTRNVAPTLPSTGAAVVNPWSGAANWRTAAPAAAEQRTTSPAPYGVPILELHDEKDFLDSAGNNSATASPKDEQSSEF